MYFALLISVPALAANPLALLTLEGRGVDAATAQDATDALRDALVADGRIDVMLATPIAEAFATGHETDLKTAREGFASGRRAYDSSDSAGAISALTEAIRLHKLSGSAWVRRAELADARWLMALCLLREGRVLDGRDQLVDVATLWPGYGASRGAGSAVATRMLAEVEEGLAKASWQPPSEAVLDTLFRVLDPGWLAVGALDAAGAVSVHVVGYDGSERLVEGEVSLPVDSLEESWTDIAAQIAEWVGVPEDDEAFAPPEDPDDEREDASEAPDRLVPIASFGPGDGGVKIRERGTIRYDDGPVTAKWWFWTAIVAAVGGTTAAAYVLAQPPELVQVQDPDALSVTVAIP